MADTKQVKAWEDLSLCRSVSSISSAASTAEGTAGNDVSSFLFDDYRDDTVSVSGLKTHCKYWLRVGHLSLGTTDAELKSLFYPYGADEAFTAWEGCIMYGYVGFDSNEMAELAAHKMHAFIPRRQSQALAVQPVSLEEVSQAYGRCTKSLMAVLYSEAAAPAVSAAIRLGKAPAVAAAEVAAEVTRASQVVLERLVAALAELNPQWPGFAAFNEELLKLLLRSLLEASDVNLAQSINCGATIGRLFQLGMITGDPYYLATRLLQRGNQSLAHLEGVCALAHTCATLTAFHISRAAFWAQVAEITTMVADRETSQALLTHLRRYTKSSAAAGAAPRTTAAAPAAAAAPFCSAQPHMFSTMPCPPPTQLTATVTSLPQPLRHFAQPHPRQEEMKRRTVYVSHLPGLLPQSMLLELLAAAGSVNKVRVCAGTGYRTLFAFVEMATVEAAQRAMCMNGLQLMGFAIRVQTARNAVQDIVKEDAQFDVEGHMIQPCLFGTSQAPLSQCIISST